MGLIQEFQQTIEKPMVHIPSSQPLFMLVPSPGNPSPTPLPIGKASVHKGTPFQEARGLLRLQLQLDVVMPWGALLKKNCCI